MWDRPASARTAVASSRPAGRSTRPAAAAGHRQRRTGHLGPFGFVWARWAKLGVAARNPVAAFPGAACAGRRRRRHQPSRRARLAGRMQGCWSIWTAVLKTANDGPQSSGNLGRHNCVRELGLGMPAGLPQRQRRGQARQAGYLDVRFVGRSPTRCAHHRAGVSTAWSCSSWPTPRIRAPCRLRLHSPIG